MKNSFFYRLVKIITKRTEIAYLLTNFFAKRISHLELTGIVLDMFEKIFSRESIKRSFQYFDMNSERVLANVRLLYDEQSRNVYLNLINYRKYRHRCYISKCVTHTSRQYIDDMIVPCDKEFLIDCGAFDGGSYKSISKKITENGCELIGAICIEADEMNFNKMVKIVNGEGCCVNKGCWSETGTIGFNAGYCSSSRISNDCEYCIEVDTIDNIFKCYGGELLTYIKFDIEGAELPALKGSHAVIEKYKPKLAISIYHSDEDMIDIIEYIHNKYPFYKMYVRHYTSFFADTVLYCIS